MKKKPAPKSRSKTSGSVPSAWSARLRKLRREHERFLARRNPVDRDWDNGVFERFKYPAITHRHAPIGVALRPESCEDHPIPDGASRR